MSNTTVKDPMLIKENISWEIVRLQYVRDNKVMSFSKRNALQALIEGLKLSLIAFD